MLPPRFGPSSPALTQVYLTLTDKPCHFPKVSRPPPALPFQSKHSLKQKRFCRLWSGLSQIPYKAEHLLQIWATGCWLQKSGGGSELSLRSVYNHVKSSGCASNTVSGHGLKAFPCKNPDQRFVSWINPRGLIHQDNCAQAWFFSLSLE